MQALKLSALLSLLMAAAFGLQAPAQAQQQNPTGYSGVVAPTGPGSAAAPARPAAPQKPGQGYDGLVAWPDAPQAPRGAQPQATDLYGFVGQQAPRSMNPQDQRLEAQRNLQQSRTRAQQEAMARYQALRKDEAQQFRKENEASLRALERMQAGVPAAEQQMNAYIQQQTQNHQTRLEELNKKIEEEVKKAQTGKKNDGGNGANARPY